ncbi:hypothetical protein PUN28_005613 [Cardiocondyla obscurior]|uniref:Uncharacterized protein n=1 Tax=Cardiocondyla obscurior TaxID=286306 RepID=A0AAW2GIL5_9HYME
MRHIAGSRRRCLTFCRPAEIILRVTFLADEFSLDGCSRTLLWRRSIYSKSHPKPDRLKCFKSYRKRFATRGGVASGKISLFFFFFYFARRGSRTWLNRGLGEPRRRQMRERTTNPSLVPGRGAKCIVGERDCNADRYLACVLITQGKRKKKKKKKNHLLISRYITFLPRNSDSRHLSPLVLPAPTRRIKSSARFRLVSLSGTGKDLFLILGGDRSSLR